MALFAAVTGVFVPGCPDLHLGLNPGLDPGLNLGPPTWVPDSDSGGTSRN